jgi:hypothetical protein
MASVSSVFSKDVCIVSKKINLIIHRRDAKNAEKFPDENNKNSLRSLRLCGEIVKVTTAV